MLSKKLETALNEQINAELYSAYLYLSMAAYCESVSLPGFAHWMEAQAKEETEHAMKIYNFVNDRGGRVVLEAIAKPPAEFSSPQQVFEQTLAHEQEVTRRIHALYELASQEKDYPSTSMLQWFIDEQVEEEKTATDILEILKRIGDKGHAIVMLDRQLAQR